MPNPLHEPITAANYHTIIIYYTRASSPPGRRGARVGVSTAMTIRAPYYTCIKAYTMPTKCRKTPLCRKNHYIYYI